MRHLFWLEEPWSLLFCQIKAINNKGMSALMFQASTAIMEWR